MRAYNPIFRMAMTNTIKNAYVAAKSAQKRHQSPVQIFSNGVQIMFVGLMAMKLDNRQIRVQFFVMKLSLCER